jgi:hypothetical protein
MSSGGSPKQTRCRRPLGLTLASGLLASGLAGVAVLQAPPAAWGTTLPTQRICSGQQVSASLTNVDDIYYKLSVPANTALSVSGTVVAAGDVSLWINEGNNSFVETISAGEVFNKTWSAQVSPRETLIRVWIPNSPPATVRMTATAGSALGVCSPLSPKERRARIAPPSTLPRTKAPSPTR